MNDKNKKILLIGAAALGVYLLILRPRMMAAQYVGAPVNAGTVAAGTLPPVNVYTGSETTFAVRAALADPFVLSLPAFMRPTLSPDQQATSSNWNNPAAT